MTTTGDYIVVGTVGQLEDHGEEEAALTTTDKTDAGIANTVLHTKLQERSESRKIIKEGYSCN